MTPAPSFAEVRVLHGEALDVLRGLPAGIAQTCVTSPPYWGLRDYGTASWEGGEASCSHRGRPKPRQDTTGSGADHGRFAETRGTQPDKCAFSVPVREVCRCGARRVDRQIGLEATPAEYVTRLVETLAEVRRVLRDDGTLWLNLGDSYANDGKWGGYSGGKIAAGLHGRTGVGREKRWTGLKAKDLAGMPWRVAFALQADGWWLRSDIVWAKPNPMPESVTDRPTKAHEYLFLLAKSERYYYDAKAVAEPSDPFSIQHGKRYGEMPSLSAKGNPNRNDNGGRGKHCGVAPGRETRNRRSVWTVATQPFAEAHFAVMPEALVEPCILAGSRPGDVVLDPFSGSGTVGVVALRHGRRFLGIELNGEYVSMARRRIAGPLFASQETPA